MTFVYPSFLWALSLIVIPIIIHLVNFQRYKIVYYSKTKLLLAINEQAKKQRNLRNWLILLMRILAIVFLVLAFAKPIPKKYLLKTSKCNNYSIYIDNSFSMDFNSEKGANVSVAKQISLSLINSMNQNSEFVVLTNDFFAKENYFYPKDIALNNIAQIQTSPNSRNLTTIVQKLNSIYRLNSNNQKCPKKLIIISDFQKKYFDLNSYILDTSYYYYFVPLSPINPVNICVDSLWFSSFYHLPSSMDTLFVKLTNNSTQTLNTKLYFSVNDRMMGVENLVVPPKQSVVKSFIFQNLEKDYVLGKVWVEDFPMVYDNVLFFSYLINQKANVLLLESSSTKFLRHLYSDTTYFNFTVSNIKLAELSKINQSDAIIIYTDGDLSSGLIENMKNFVQKGGNIILVPNSNCDLKKFNNFLQNFNLPNFVNKDTQDLFVTKVNMSASIFSKTIELIPENAEYPKAHEYFVVDRRTKYQKLLSLENDEVFLLSQKFGQGSVFLFTSDIFSANNDFMLNPISFPIFFTIPFLKQKVVKDYYLTNYDKVIEIPFSPAEIISLKHVETGQIYYPNYFYAIGNKTIINLGANDIPQGNYLILADDKVVNVASFNFVRNESDLSFMSPKQIDSFIDANKIINAKVINPSSARFEKEIVADYHDFFLWKILIIFALLCLLAEILLIRLLKI